MKRHLQIFLGDRVAAEEPDGPLPTRSGVLYAHPNPDGSRKMCVNCIMWVSGSAQCEIHDPMIAAGPRSVCGYHVFGQPLAVWQSRPGIQYVDPADSGLEVTAEGTSCSNCRWFDDGYCVAVVDEVGATAQIEPLGCCTRWEG